MTTKQKEGYDLARGVTIYVGQILLLGIGIVLLMTAVRNGLGWGLDDTDKDAWHRSGLTIHTDAKTGIEYLSDGQGGLVKRESR